MRKKKEIKLEKLYEDKKVYLYAYHKALVLVVIGETENKFHVEILSKEGKLLDHIEISSKGMVPH